MADPEKVQKQKKSAAADAGGGSLVPEERVDPPVSDFDPGEPLEDRRLFPNGDTDRSDEQR